MTPGVKSYTLALVTKTREKGQAMTENSLTDETSEALNRLTTALKELREAHTELIDEIRLLKKREHQLNPLNREILPLLEKIVDEEKLIMDATKNQEQQQ